MGNIGLVTAAIAGIFTIVGIIVGFFLCKISVKPMRIEVPKTNIEERFNKLLSNLEGLKNNLKTLTSEKSNDIRSSFESILSQISELKAPLKEAGVTRDSMQRVDNMINDIQSTLKTPTTIDANIFTKFKDNLSIIRNDLQSIKLNQSQRPRSKQTVKDILSAIDTAKEINRACVASELISMVDSIKEPDKTKLTEALDRISINSKELVLKLKDLKSDLEGVRA